MSTQLDDKLHWYKDAIIYELHIKAFRDSSGDGIGDFKGLLEKLDYLEDLGVTAIWVLPFYPSPLKDDGYDIADYYNINPSYGDINQFKQFLNEAHNRNLKVITELVINHSSDQHPWFQRARNAPKDSPERAFYVWTDNPEQYKDVRIIFQDFEGSNWTWDSVAQQYYWHRFFHHQPDLNYDSELVQEEIMKILDYWCAMGVDGFRLDAVPYLYEREGTNGENLPETHVFLKKLRKHIDENYPGTVFLAEANMWPEDSASYFGDGDECHMNYHFPVMPRMFMALQMEDRYPITDIFDQTPEIPETCQWAIFLRNHDELTLEMVTDEERDYMYKVYAKDPKAKINLGIRHRLAPLMENNRRKIELINSLLFSLSGTPVIYYGDEIGMGDNFYLGDRDGVRTPMQWSADRNAGFSEANPQRLYLPIILDPEYHYESVNVEMQTQNTSSLFWYMKRIITMRKKYKAFSRGNMKFINVDNPKILAFTRSYENETLLIIVNLSRYAQPAEIDLGNYMGYELTEMFSKNKFPAIKEETPYFFTLSPYSFQWFILKQIAVQTEVATALPVIEVTHWEDILKNRTRETFIDNILPSYLLKTKWFRGKDRLVYNIAILDSFSIPTHENKAVFLLIEVNYESGLPETYQLPITFIKDHDIADLNKNHPEAIIARVKTGDAEGSLCDAFFTHEVQHVIIKKMGQNDVLQLANSNIQFSANESLKNHLQKHQEIKSRVIGVEDANTSIAANNCFFLKMYRYIERSINPDVEITRFLTEQVDLPQVPDYVGAIEWKYEKESIVLGMMQVMVEYHGNGRTYMGERLINYNERIVARKLQSDPSFELRGSLYDPVSFDDLPQNLKDLIGTTVAEGVRLIGVRTGELHKSLAFGNYDKDFVPEEFSLHYQRSLFAGFQSLVRESFSNHTNNITKLPDNIKKEVEDLIARKEDVLKTMRHIYTKKFDVVRTRIHGNYHLGQVLFTGKDLAFPDFAGDTMRRYSNRRIKRSPLSDVADMIRSLYYAAYEGLFLNNQVTTEDIPKLIPFARLWGHYVTGFFMHSYLQTVQGSRFVPEQKEDFEILLKTYIIEKAVYSLNYELYNRPNWVIVPLRIIKALIK